VEAVALEAGLEPAWDSFVRRARNGHFMFERAFMTYHADRFEDASLLVLDKARVVGVLPTNRRGAAIHSHQGLTFGGLIVDDAGTTEVFEALEACAAFYRRTGAEHLIYKPLPWIYHRRPAQDDLYWLFRRGARLVRRDVTSTINLAARGPISQRRTRGAARARRAGLRYERSTDYASFWPLLAGMLDARHGVGPVHSEDEIARLAAWFPENISLHLALSPSDDILAGIIVFQTPRVAHAQYICVGEAGREVGALDGLVEHLLATFRDQVAFFDFGISNEADGQALNIGLLAQKEGFGASAVVHDGYEVALAS
jgi:hypothetical protein